MSDPPKPKNNQPDNSGPQNGTPPRAEPEKTWMPGQLNDISAPIIPKTIGQGSTDILKQMTLMLRHFNTFNAFDNTGPYVGVVLKDETENFNVPEAAESEDEPYRTPDDPETGRASVLSTRLTYLRVRIPEVHAALPIPSATGGDADEKNQKIMDMFPVFAAKSNDGTKYPQVLPGSLVWVDYGNKTNWTDPVYLGPVNEGDGKAGSHTKPPNSRKNHKDPCKDQYKRNKAPGDSLPGTNVKLEPYQGLPRLSRKTLERMKTSQKPLESYKFSGDQLKSKPWGLINPITGEAEENNKQLKEIRKAYTAASAWHLKIWFGHIGSNGPKDRKHTPHERHTIIMAPMYFQPDEPFEIIYWFHGLSGFKTKNFKTRYFPQMNKLQELGRNFVIVIPELPWSERGTGPSKGKLFYRQRLAWDTNKKDTTGGDFAQFHKASLQIIDTYIAPRAKVAEKGVFISLYGHSNGGSAIAQAAKQGSLNEVQPDRIFFSDSDYVWGYGGGKGAVYETWKSYIKNNKKSVWLTVLTMDSGRPDGGPRKQSREFFNKDTKAEERKKHYTYSIEVNKPADEKKWAAKIKGAPAGAHIMKQKYSGDLHSWCGENALLMTHPAHIKKMEEIEKAALKKTKKETEKANQNSTPQKEAEKAEATSTKKETEKQKEATAGTAKPEKTVPEAPSVDKSNSAKPKPQGAPTAASGKPKASTTEKGDPPKPTFKSSPAVKWDENRVTFKQYGALKPSAKTLVKLEGTHKAHVLLVPRYNAMKAAAAKDGVTMNIASGWRKHRWTSRADYEAKMVKEYGKPGETKAASIKRGKQYKAYQSPHETGLAIDIVGHGMATKSKQYGTREETLKKHREMKLGKWLINNAHKFGFTPYKTEAWHYELRLPIDAYISGKEFTDKYDIRVNDVGKAHNPNLGGGTGGKKSTRKAKPCVTVGGGLKPGTDAGIEITAATSAKGLGKDLVLGPPAIGFRKGEKMDGKYRSITGFVVHETAGWPTNIHERKIKQRKGKVGIHFWNTSDGKIMQTCHPCQRMGHAHGASYTACGTEMNTQGPMHPKYYSSISKWIGLGSHFVGDHKRAKKGYYDIKSYEGSSPQAKIMMLPRPKQCEAVWRLIVSLSKSPPDVTGMFYMYGGKKHAVKCDIKIAFPTVSKTLGVFTWARWAGKPVPGISPKGSPAQNMVGTWWEKTRPAGIYCHFDAGYHSDGKMGVYYCLARAKGLSPNDAYYAMVGALCTTKNDGKHAPKGVKYSELPGKKMVAKGKAKYPFGLNSKSWSDMGPGAMAWNKSKKKHPARIKWDAYAKANPKTIGDPDKPV